MGKPDGMKSRHRPLNKIGGTKPTVDLSDADTRLAEIRRKTSGGAMLSAESVKGLRD
jgi:hypothetical protein